MKYCKKCLQTFDSNNDYCSNCGSPLQEYDEKQILTEEKRVFCQHCGRQKTDAQALFCDDCGKPYSKSEVLMQEIKDTAKNSELAKNLKTDLSNSESIKTVKKHTKKIMNFLMQDTKRLIAVITVIAVVVVAVVCNIHTCDDCREKYIGKEHLVVIYGEKRFVCENCYDYYLY